METNDFPTFGNFFQRVSWRGLILVIVFLGLVIGLGALIGTGISPWIALVGLVPVVFFLLLKPDLALYLFIASLPLELVLTGDILTLPKLMGFLALTAWLISWLTRRPVVHWDLALSLMGLFILWGTISIGWSIDISETQRVIISYLLLTVLYFLLINHIKGFRELERVLLALGIGGIILVASGVYQLISGAYMDLPAERLAGLSSNSNLYATWGVAILPAFYIMAKRNRFLLLLAIVCVVGLLITGLYSQSRGGFISLVGFCLTLLVFRTSRGRALALVVLISFLAWKYAPADFWLRWELISTQGIDRLRDLWPLGWKIFLQNPWLGTGLGTSGELIDQLGHFQTPVGSVHSAPLAVAMDLGVFGILIYLGFLFIPAVRLIKSAQYLDEQGQNNLRNIAIILIASLVGFLLSWVKSGSMEASKILWLLLGIGSGMSNLSVQPLKNAIHAPKTQLFELGRKN